MSFHDLHVQFWQDIFARPSGPLAFRFILQPIVAAILATRDGWRDAQMYRKPYFWALVHDPIRRMPRLGEGLMAVSRVLLLGAGMDLVYQAVELHAFRPLETVVIALGLAFVPYLIVRGPAARVGRHILRKRADEEITRRVGCEAVLVSNDHADLLSGRKTKVSDEQVTHH